MPPRPGSPYRLLVEGSDDLHSILHLLLRHGFNWDDEATVRPYVDATGSIEKLLRVLPVTLKSSHERIGVVVDANSRLPNRWAQLRASAAAAGVQLPEVPDPVGTIVAGFRPDTQVGFWLMPDNTEPGTGKVLARVPHPLHYHSVKISDSFSKGATGMRGHVEVAAFTPLLPLQYSLNEAAHQRIEGRLGRVEAGGE
jgi:hypothetical protein